MNHTSGIKRIGVLTSGGDAPGMNAAVRAVVRAGIYYGMEVYGIKNGFSGLLDGQLEPMTLRSVSEILNHGGTVLHTSRCPEFRTPDGREKAASIARVFKLDAIVVIGGDGSFAGAKELSEQGIPVIGIPATIDNDIGCSDYTIGFDTALNTVKDAVDKIKDTTYSHERCSIIEVMGRHAGYIAINAAIANGAEICLIPEKPFELEADVIQPILAGRSRGKTHFILIVAEGACSCEELAAQIKQIIGITPAVSILGYIQRGGSPTVRDRVIASQMSVHAVECLARGEVNRIVAYKGERVVDIDIAEALAQKKSIDPHTLLTSEILSL